MQVALALGVEMDDDDDRQAGSRIAGLSKSDAAYSAGWGRNRSGNPSCVQIRTPLGSTHFAAPFVRFCADGSRPACPYVLHRPPRLSGAGG
jgi:hypothetical protein